MKKRNATIALTSLTLIMAFIISYNASAKKKEPDLTKEVGSVYSKLLPQLKQEIDVTDIELRISPQKAFERQVSSMTLEEKVGQLFLARVPETKQIEDLKQYKLGGYLLFSRDIKGQSHASLKKKIATYQDAASLPLIIASDEEGGVVSRLSYEKGFLKEPFPSPQKIYQKSGIKGIKTELKKQADILHQLGISMSLAPVADVSTQATSFIYDRTLGKDVVETANYIETAVNTMKELEIGSTLKHFPGYGDNLDSHLEIVRDKRSLKELEEKALPPFIKGIEAGADSVLITHNIVNALDDQHPASISPEVYNYLRDDLDFQGVIMTDDFDMEGLKRFATQEEAAISAISSGADLVLSSNYQRQIPAVIQAVNDKQIKSDKINQSVTRVLLLKYQLKLIDLP